MSGPLHTVHVRVNDAATGQPTPVRIRFTGPEGEYLAPFGRLTEFATDYGVDVGGNVMLGDREYAYIDGTCEIDLPADPVTIEVHKGPEYTPLRQQVTLGPGKLALRLAIERWIDLRQQGWYSGDTRLHLLTPFAALLEGAAEDVAVINLLAMKSWVRAQFVRGDRYLPAIPNILAFSGQRPALEMPGHLVVVNTTNDGRFLGRLGLLNCHRIVFPLEIGSAEGAESFAYSWSLADWCDQCHRKGGLVVWSEARHKDMEENSYGEALADLILGKIDALEVEDLNWCQGRHSPWYELLNCGFQVPLVGASHKVSNAAVLGGIRTYARLQPGQEFTYPNWIEAVRAGRTFVTDGPLLFFTVNGHDPGATIELPGEEGKVHVRAEARGSMPFDRLELIANGVAVAATEATGAPASALLETDLEVAAGGWLAARCWGSRRVLTSSHSQPVAAHTSPIYVRVHGHPPAADAIAHAFLADHLERMRAWVETKARFASDRQREQVVGVFESAAKELAKRSGR